MHNRQLVPDVKIAFNNRLPLHWACWNNLPCEIVELLLEKDENNKNSYQLTGYIIQSDHIIRAVTSDDGDLSLTDSDGGNISLIYSDLSIDISDVESIDPIDTEEGNQSSDGIALHLALKYGRRKTISMLLQEVIEGGKRGMRTSLEVKDNSGRVPLHIACQYSIDPQVIQLLLRLDQMKVTTHTINDNGSRNNSFVDQYEVFYCKTQHHYV